MSSARLVIRKLSQQKIFLNLLMVFLRVILILVKRIQQFIHHLILMIVLNG